MEHLVEFAWTVAASSVGTTALLAAAAFLCKTKISNWLAKDLEAAKAKHQRELEAYKASLIATVERVKAEQSAKLAGATKIVQRKFDTLEALSRALRGHSAAVVSSLAMQTPDTTSRERLISKLHARSVAIDDALEDASPFLSVDDYGMILDFNSDAHDQVILASEVPGKGAHVVSPPLAEDLRQAQYACNAKMNALINGMMNME